MSDKQTIYIKPVEDFPQFAPVRGWRRWLNWIGFKFQGKPLALGMPGGILMTNPANVFALKKMITDAGYPVQVMTTRGAR